MPLSPVATRLRACALLACVMLLAACSTQTAERSEDLRSSAQSSEDADWQAYIQDPGQAGVDYDPACIMVGYRIGASLPAGLSAGLSAAPLGQASAAQRPNAMLRENREFEAFTDAIALRYGWKIDQQVYLRKLNFASFTVPPGVQSDLKLAALRRDFASCIEYAAYAPMMHPCWEPNDPMYSSSTLTGGAEWSLKKSRFNVAWDKTHGSASMIVAIVDTGCFLDHQDFQGQLLTPADFPAAQLDIANGDNSMEDHFGHGTFLCGLVGAKTNENFGMAGAAPDCKTLPVKISEAGEANHARFIAGCMLGFTLGAKVVNLSWMSTGGSPPLAQMVNDIYDGGGLLFVSAANEGTTDQTWPAAYDNAVAVGNSNSSDGRSPSSTYGDWVDIAAPGEGLSSTSNTDASGYNGAWTGTSFSAPLTAAAAALLWSYKPDLTNAEVRTLLETTGAPTTGFNPSNSIKRLDVGAAMDAIPDPILTPTIDGLVPGTEMLGTVPQVNQIFVQVSNPANIGFIRYTLDCAPLGVLGPADIVKDVAGGVTFTGNLVLDAQFRPNQQAILHAQCFDTAGEPGMELTASVYIFNMLGDVNGDGKVDATDLAAYSGVVGLQSGDIGYLPYFDSNLDGTITETDAAAVGYFWAP